MTDAARAIQRHLNQVGDGRKQKLVDEGQVEEAAGVTIPKILEKRSLLFARFRINLDKAMKRSTEAGKGGTRKARVLKPEVLDVLNTRIVELEPTATVVSVGHIVVLGLMMPRCMNSSQSMGSLCMDRTAQY